MVKQCILLWLTVICLFLTQKARGLNSGLRSNTTYWRNIGHRDIRQTVDTVDQLYNGKAKNVALFVGSGMDITTLMLAGYIRKDDFLVPKQYDLYFEKYRHVGLQRVYSEDYYAPDAASAATAMTMGVKTRNKVLGYDSGVTPSACHSINNGVALKSMFQEAKEAGRAIGLVTTGKVTGPTIASTYARTPNSDWTTSGSLSDSQRNQGCKDIATQFQENAMDFDVIFGGGRKELKGTHPDNGESIIDNWKEHQENMGRKFKFVSDKPGYSSINTSDTDYVLGLLAPGEMAYQLDWDTSQSVRNEQPTLSGMVTKALEILNRKENGFFLLVDSSNMDLAHSKTMAKYAIHEAVKLDRAAKVVRDNTDPSETLVIVAANYGYTTTVGNNMFRGINPTELCHSVGSNDNFKADDKEYYTGISYGSGPLQRGDTQFLTTSANSANNVQYQAVVPNQHSTHGGQHVSMYAEGVKAHLISSAHESIHIYNTAMYAACLGEYENRDGC